MITGLGMWRFVGYRHLDIVYQIRSEPLPPGPPPPPPPPPPGPPDDWNEAVRTAIDRLQAAIEALEALLTA
jgi:hypothetical protein